MEGPVDASDVLAELLEGLGAGGRITIYRRKPSYAVGHLATLEIDPDEGPASVLASLQDHYGGGTYLVRAIRPDGHFIKGATRQIIIAGEPLQEGRRANRETDRPVTPTVVVHAPEPTGTGIDANNLFGVMAKMFESAASGRFDDLVRHQEQMIKLASQNRQGPTGVVESVSDQVKTIRELASLGRSLNENGGGSRDDDDGGDGEMSMEKMFMYKMMSDMGMNKQNMGQQMGMQQPMGQPTQQSAPMWMQTPQGFVQVVQTPQGWQPVSAPQPAPAQPYQPPAQTAHAQESAPTQQPTQPPPSPMQGPPPPSAPTPSAPADNDGENEFEDITAEDVALRITELGAQDPASAQAFFMGVMQGIRPDVRQNMEEFIRTSAAAASGVRAAYSEDGSGMGEAS